MHISWSLLADIIGVIGVIFVLTAYLWLSMGRWRSDQIIYHLFNFFGAWLILYSLYFHWNTASVIIEFAWIAISLVGIIRIFSRKSKK